MVLSVALSPIRVNGGWVRNGRYSQPNPGPDDGKTDDAVVVQSCAGGRFLSSTLGRGLPAEFPRGLSLPHRLTVERCELWPATAWAMLPGLMNLTGMSASGRMESGWSEGLVVWWVAPRSVWASERHRPCAVSDQSADDLVEITHRARGREGFARGAVMAAEMIGARKGLIRFDELVMS